MNVKTRLYSAIVGGIVGAIVAVFVTNFSPTAAQDSPPNLGDIVCTSLTVEMSIGIVRTKGFEERYLNSREDSTAGAYDWSDCGWTKDFSADGMMQSGCSAPKTSACSIARYITGGVCAK